MLIANNLMQKWLDDYSIEGNLQKLISRGFRGKNKELIKPKFILHHNLVCWAGINGHQISEIKSLSLDEDRESLLNELFRSVNQFEFTPYLPLYMDNLSRDKYIQACLYIYKSFRRELKQQFPLRKFKIMLQGEIGTLMDEVIDMEQKPFFRLYFTEIQSKEQRDVAVRNSCFDGSSILTYDLNSGHDTVSGILWEII